MDHLRPIAVAVVLLLGTVTLAGASDAAPVAVTEHTLEVEGIELHYLLAGEGEPLVLLHSGTQSSLEWSGFLDGLGGRYRLVVPDLRGHGGSTNPDGVWTTRQFARDVLALLDHLGIDRYRGIGASAGGMTLLHMATMQPDRAEAIVVVGVGTYLPVSCREVLAATDGDTLSDAGWQRYRMLHPGGDGQIRALLDWVASLAHSYNDMTFTPARLATITAPTLVVHGDRDYCFPVSMAVDVFEAVPRSSLWVVPDGPHVPIHGPRAALFTSTVLGFFGPSAAQNENDR